MTNFEEYSRIKIEESLKEGLRAQWINSQIGRRRSNWLKNLAGLFSFQKVFHSLKGVEQPAILNESGC